MALDFLAGLLGGKPINFVISWGVGVGQKVMGLTGLVVSAYVPSLVSTAKRRGSLADTKVIRPG